ncbi:MAG: hypothetical protein U9O65_10340 [Thermotogota bacterium]|nr:hypothetical protein [Thermotogota bacterium]
MWTTSSVLVDYDDPNYPVYFIKQIKDKHKISMVKKCFYKDNPFASSERVQNEIWNWFKTYFLDAIDFRYFEIMSQMINSNDLPTQVKNELIFWISCVCDRVMADLAVNMILKSSKEGKSQIEMNKIYDYADQLTHLDQKKLKKAVKNFIDLLEFSNITYSNKESIVVNNFKPSLETFAFALFYLFDQKQIPINILRSYKLKYLMLDINEIIDYIKKLEQSGLVNFTVKKEIFNLEPKIEFEELHNYFLKK